MLSIAYLANQFPSPVEPYVSDEINELRRRGLRVITGTVRNSSKASAQDLPDVVLQSVGIVLLLRGAWLCLRKGNVIAPLLMRTISHGRESFSQRIKALLHTWAGACYALLLESHDIAHIHVHHGYFGSWIAMTAAKLLGVGFSMTLHGSDLLIGAAFLDIKLAHCAFCLTVSDYNRGYILEHYPGIDASKVLVSRLGVALVNSTPHSPNKADDSRFSLLTIGRLHAVKDHAFLIEACAHLHLAGVDFECSIAGEGPERHHLESLIEKLDLDSHVTLLGHVGRAQLHSLYSRADLVVLTSRSEGLPLVLMEAMARGKIVLAPAITGIPELVIPDKTGFLYQPGSIEDFLARVLMIRSLTKIGGYGANGSRRLQWISHAARAYVRQNFNRNKNLESFGDLFLSRIAPAAESLHNENPVLQQI